MFDTVGIIKIRGGQFLWFVNLLQVRGDVIFGERGGGERKDNSGKIYFIWNELSFFTMVNDDDTVIASQVDLKHYMLIGPLTPIISSLNAQS